MEVITRGHRGFYCCGAHCEQRGQRHVKPSEVCMIGIRAGFEVGLSEGRVPGEIAYAIRPKDAPRYPRNIVICNGANAALAYIELGIIPA